MRNRLLSRLVRHWDIFIFLIGAIFTSGVMYAQNSEAIAHLADRTDKLEKKVEAIGEIKEDVSAIKKQTGMIWDIMQRGK